MPKLVDKPVDLRPLGTVDIQALQALACKLTDKAWEQVNQGKENDFHVLNSTKHLIFRFTPGNRDAATFYETAAWPIWAPLLQPVMDQASAPYDFAKPIFPKAMLARLAPGTQIDRHTDGQGSNLQTHKIHVPLQTNHRAFMSIGDRSFHLETGQAYEVNNIAPHSVRNDGSVDRIHLIFEVYDGAT